MVMDRVEEVREDYKKTEVGEIPEDWNIEKISNVGQIVSGGTPSKTQNKFWLNGNIAWATPTDITSNKKKYINRTNLYITEEGLKNSSANLLPPGSILMTSRATIGARCINKVPMATNQGFKSVICGNELFNEYFYYLIDILVKKLIKLSGGSTFLEISKKDISNLKIPLPPIQEQQKIASILSTVDDQIQTTDNLINSYVLLKKGLMQTLLTKGTGHTEFKKTDIGEIPVDWEVKKLKDIGVLKGGSGFKVKYQGMLNLEYPFFKVSDMNLLGNNIFMKDCNNSINEEIRKKLKAKLFDKNTIIFAKVGAALLLNRRRLLVKPSCIDNNMMGLEVKNGFYKYFYYILQMIDFGDFVNDGALPSVNQSQVGNIKVGIPTFQEQQKIASILSTVDDRIELYKSKKEKLKELKKGLMQKLLTGKIRVKV